ncbi:hypothetical protein [Blastococcus mobilis]|uniref:Uncharacterized protein n=1 Tax=Blastococcus mobilis TaxID=1938746 RepID=A0A238ZGI7_9ACTN|nr:hypothetical protein [Blastococcus mobilis]SNR82447.1 hypothetical protein SAMN06272737_12865 [Blastococcus mobilis]
MRARRLLTGAIAVLSSVLTVGALGLAPAAAIANGVAAGNGAFPSLSS